MYLGDGFTLELEDVLGCWRCLTVEDYMYEHRSGIKPAIPVLLLGPEHNPMQIWRPITLFIGRTSTAVEPDPDTNPPEHQSNWLRYSM